MEDLRNTLFDKGKEFAIKKGDEWLSEKEQQLRLRKILEKAVRRGLIKFQTLQERDQYKDILTNLLEPGAHSDTLRREAMTLFSLSGTPNLAELNEIYNRSLRFRHLSETTSPSEVNAAPYLVTFFEALTIELYADSFFKTQIRDVIQTRAAQVIPQQMAEVNVTLREIHETLRDAYTEEQFQQDIATYAAFLEQTFHTLKIIGVLPKEQNPDPELHGIFVPLCVALTDQGRIQEKQDNALVALLREYSRLVLLGDPGSGKSTAIRYLTWSHAKANLTPSEIPDVPLLPGHPLPLRIELRLLMQDRRQRPDYSFLSYASDVLLGRESVKINPIMFEKLLTQNRMIVLFDGLDEVATLEERQRLVQEIEHFAMLYPNNYLLVTSRPVGYEQAGCSKQHFTHGQVQPFDDDQIHQFLERWYTYVLRLEPLPYQEQQELETLFGTLKENTRLHRLAENPLLLTVITALYRSQRLPEKRVQVYDKCAELLLETWSKLKGTDARWRDMKMGKDDQFACVAHLGFQLHQYSQEQSDGSTKEVATDVPARLMLREIEHFLNDRKLLTERAEQHKEARQFLELMRIEAGLIVERGTDENGENIYGFVHRTFQEYFAASDVYERYRQEEDPAIIRDFLVEHLHDPHWHEVTLLLLAKLGRKPLTVRLRQLLEGKIKSRRSCYKDILQQDLFFVCDCMIEEMAIENDLGEAVISDLCRLVTTSPFSPQRTEALQKLGALMQTKEFASLTRSKLTELMTSDTLTDISLKIQVLQTLYMSSPADSEERQQAAQKLLQLVEQVDLPIEQKIQATQVLYEYSPADSEERQQAAQRLLQLVEQVDLPIEQKIQATQALYQFSPADSENRQLARQVLWQLAQDIRVSADQRLSIIKTPLQSWNANCSDKAYAVQMLLTLLSQEKATRFLEKHWSFSLNSTEPTEIRCSAELARQELLPPRVRSNIFSNLKSSVSQFSKITPCP